MRDRRQFSTSAPGAPARVFSRGLPLAALLTALQVGGQARGDQPAGRPADQTAATPPGHSIHGEAFDEGPRQEARLLGGMGKVHLEVTTSSPEAQCFFDQGVAQLHTFYYFEAERSFRQVAFLDPKCAMAYWGMAMANFNNRKRAAGFLEKARGLMDQAGERERKYIRALSDYHAEGKKDSERRQDYVKGLEAVVLAHPDDLESRAFLAWFLLGERVSSRVAVNVLIEEVLRRSPLHPGAHHYRIHLWDESDPAQALESALAYARAAPGIAHAWHMPGHIYNGLSRWKEAAYQQEGSARVDHAHMRKHSLLPFQIHNYAHNQHYLIANLSHLGRVRDALALARNLVETPRDPQRNDPSNGGSAQRLGRFSLLRIYARFELWDDLLADPHLDWSDSRDERAFQAYGRGLAFLEKGQAREAGEEAAALERILAEKDKGGDGDLIETLKLELRGRQRVREGKLVEGFELLDRGARLQTDRFRGDLSGYPRPLRETLGFAHLEARNWGLAEANFREVLDHRKNTLVSLAGLVEACERGGKRKEAAEAHQAFLEASKDADRDLPLRKRLEANAPALLIASEPPGGAPGGGPRAGPGGGSPPGNGIGGSAPAPHSELHPPPAPSGSEPGVDLAGLGPLLWSPTPAPDFTLEDPAGKKFRLGDLRGKNVLLVFSLGGGCPHCLDQLLALGKEKAAFESLEARVVVVSDEPVEKTRELLAGPSGPQLPSLFLNDPGREVARLYQAQDTFENLPLHGVVFIDREGNTRWSRIASQPFMEMGFLKGELERVDRLLTLPAH